MGGNNFMIRTYTDIRLPKRWGHSARPHPGQVAEVGLCVGPYVVVGLLPGPQLKVLGAPQINLQMFNHGWKIVVAHTSTAEM
jgi:hypothetical protein